MSDPSHSDLIKTFGDLRLLVIGDVMLDRFIWGNVSRISPEAPVPVVEVSRESLYPGGAANVARNLTPFGATVELIGLAGDDANGTLLLDTLGKADIGTEHVIVDPEFTTITKTRVVARQQQVVRIDWERRTPLSEADRAAVLEQLRAVAADVDGMVIEDYGKGLIDQALVDAVVNIASDNDVRVTVDPNPRNPIDWHDVTTVKPNRGEAFHEAGLPEPPHDGVEPLEDRTLLEVGGILLEKWRTGHVLVTLGEQGMMLFSRNAEPYHIPTRAKEVFDVSGAGDTAIAVYTMALCAGADARTAADLSNVASGIVVGKLGTAAITQEDLLSAVEG